MTDTALFADVEKRTIRGLLLPYGELSSPSVSNTPPVMFAKGTVELPADPAVVTANEGHSQFAGRGHAIQLEDTDGGVVAEFAIARTPEGDALLSRAADPDPAKRPRLSAEIAGLVRDGAKALKAKLTGAAFVPQGAFPSAALFALAEDEADRIKEAVEEAVEAALAKFTQPTEDSPSEANPQEETMTAAAAVVPDGLNPPAGTKKEEGASFFAALTAYAEAGDRSGLEKLKGADSLFAIATIQHSGPSAVTIGADTQVPQALGEVWKRRRYERKYATLFSSDTLTSMKLTGWRWTTEPTVDTYSGNTAEIPSNAVDTEPTTADAIRLAGGHKLDRRYIDFPDSGVYASYLDKSAESYARVSDQRALAAAVSGATTLTVTGTTYPYGIAAALPGIVDGALAIITAENTPSAAVVSPELWRDIVLTGSKDVLGYLTASLGLENGDLAGFRILPGPVGTGKVLTIAKEGMTFAELPGVPIRVEGIDPHHGAIDPALFGYYATLVNNAAALQLVTVSQYTEPTPPTTIVVEGA